MAELAALRKKQAALEAQVAAEQQRAMKAEADRRVAEEKVSNLEQKDAFMMTTVNSWKSTSDAERATLFKHLGEQSNQVQNLLKMNDDRTVHN
jgi:hypothetical protein